MTDKKQTTGLPEGFVLAYSDDKIVAGVMEKQDKDGNVIFTAPPVDMTTQCISAILSFLHNTTPNGSQTFTIKDGRRFEVTVKEVEVHLWERPTYSGKQWRSIKR